MTDIPDPQPADPSQALDRRAAEEELDLIEFYDDGEWHAQLVGEGGNELIADGYGGNPSEAREALARNLGLSSL